MANTRIHPDDMVVLTYQSGAAPKGYPATREVPMSRISKILADSGGSVVELYKTGYSPEKVQATNVAATLAASSPLFVAVTPVVNNVVGTQYWINAGMVEEFMASPSAYTNANATVRLRSSFKTEVIHVSESLATLRTDFNAAGITGSYWELGTAQTATADKTMDANSAIHFRDAATQIYSSGSDTLDIEADASTGRINIGSAQNVLAGYTRQSDGLWDDSQTGTITAFAGGGQGSATQLTRTVNHVTTVATTGDSVKLPAATAGRRVVVINDEAGLARNLAVFPQTGEEIDGLGANASISIDSGIDAWLTFFCDVAGHWESSAELTVSTLQALTLSGTITASNPIVSPEPGTPGTNVTAVHYSSDGKNYVTVLTLNSVSISIAGAAAEGVGALIYTFPAGKHFHQVTSHTVTLQGGGTVDADTPDVGIGSVIASGAVAVLGGTPTFEDYVTGSAAANCSGTAMDVGPIGATAGIHTGISLNATGDTKTVHLNLADTWAGADTITVTGTVTLKWSIM